jgi:hypothetical protein
MKTIEQIHAGKWEKAEPSSADIDAELKDVVEPILKEHAARLDEKIRDAMEHSTTGFLDKKEVYERLDLSEVANDIWEALNEIDDSPIAQIIHGAVFGVTDRVMEVGAAIYSLIEERLGETLTTTINDNDAFSRLVDPMIKAAQAEYYEELFNHYDEQVKHAPDPQPEDIYPNASPEELQKLLGYDGGDNLAITAKNDPPPLLLEDKRAIPLSEALPSLDYLEAHVISDHSAEANNGLER